MNLYLLLAIAFGAITGAADAPVTRTPLASVIVRRETRAECGRPARAGRALRPSAVIAARDARQVPALRPYITGFASPRAPATIG